MSDSSDAEEEEYLSKEQRDMLESLKSSAVLVSSKRSNKKRKLKSTFERSRQDDLSDDELHIDKDLNLEAIPQALKVVPKQNSNVEESEPVDEAVKEPVFNKVAIIEKIEDFKIDDDLSKDFDQPLACCSAFSAATELKDIEDDLEREVLFYKQALETVKTARLRLHGLEFVGNLGLAVKKSVRPEDYFAEMIKSDKHMGRIKQNLLFEKQKMEAFEKRKSNKEMRKVAKKVQAERLKEKGQTKKIAKELGEEFRSKNREASGQKSTFNSSSNSRGEAKSFGRDSDMVNGRPKKTRNMRDQKFGFGGKKRDSKKNTRGSTNDIFGSNRGSNKKPRLGKDRRRK